MASYDLILKEGFVKDKNKVVYCPDFALFYKTSIRNAGKGKVGICFREDKERTLSENIRKDIIKRVNTDSFNFTTSKKNRVIPIRKRKKQ